MEKNIRVTDETGKELGYTYPKRANGLIKNGRARYVDDCTIRLSCEAPGYKSEAEQMNYIFLNPRNWSEKDGIERTFIDGFEGSLEEILQIGSWTTECVATSEHFLLDADTQYALVFWLNGGENESAGEICDLLISFGADEEFRNKYKLNRNYIKPLLHHKGWELYSIGFTTPHTEGKVDVRFSFHSKNAPMAVKSAKEPSYYSQWQDDIDEFAAQRPQRHNIVFEDGWPTINMQGGNRYSTEVLRRRKLEESESPVSKANRIKDILSSLNISINRSDDEDEDEDDEEEELEELIDDLSDDLDDIRDDLEDDWEDYRDYSSSFEELRKRCKDLSVSEEKNVELIAIETLLKTSNGLLLKVDVSGLESRLSVVSSLSEAEDLEKELSDSRDCVDNAENLLDDAEDLLENLEDWLDDLEEDSDED